MANQGIIQPLTCPTCGGIITWQVPEHSYCCPLGHCFSPQELDVALQQMLRVTLYKGMRQLRERELLQHQIAQRGLLPTQSDDSDVLAQQLLAVLSQLAPE